ncbi:MAG TPA: hypothetical protein DDW50_09010 [Firmicutes bacterium]|jgi:hypothetical protein|nr:hypothetical protein [Bacillota bacterium]
MIQINQDDLLRALKRCKGIAKQDLLPSRSIPQSDFRKTHAEARRETYTQLIELVEGEGIQDACVFAFTAYQSLPELSMGGSDPAALGHAQALEMFFNVIGIDRAQMKMLHDGSIDFNQLLNYQPFIVNELTHQSLV